ncbi:hypothetical protein C8Q76DRAFT_702435 [Earliella scabrosa]|nr:hypothetical protein C8Q76DRAFT_702435 [Earliella scabrosa]
MQNSRLPIELCERIIDFASINPLYGTDYDQAPIDYPTLLACVLVCQAWHPRARHNLFSRVVVRSCKALQLFLLASEAGARADELELTLPLAIDDPSLDLDHPGGDTSHKNKERIGASLASPAFTAAVRSVTLLTLSDSEWLYPRTYITIFGSSFSSLRTLDLYRVTFPTAGDLARLLWSFRTPQTLECTEVNVEFGRMSTLPLPSGSSPGRSSRRESQLSSLTVCFRGSSVRSQLGI